MRLARLLPFVPALSVLPFLGFVVIGSLAAVPQAPQDAAPVALSADAQAALQTVRKARIFAIGGIGIAGTLPSETKAYRALLKDTQGAQAFRSLLADKTATSEARAYGALGLLTLNPGDKTAKDALAAMRNTSVHTGAGCIVMTEKLTPAVERFMRKPKPAPTEPAQTSPATP